MIRKLDRLWFALLGRMYQLLVRWAEAHCRREKERRLRQLLASSQHHLN